VVEGPGAASGEVRQRWRIAFARGEPLLDLGQPGIAVQWQDAFRQAGLPVAMSQARSPRPRLVYAAPLPVGMPAEHELLDATLAARVPMTSVRAGLAAALPPGLDLVDLFDVWIGASALTTALTAADYRVAIAQVSRPLVDEACRRLLAADALPRERVKGEGRAIHYDLRPLVLSVAIAETSSGSTPDGRVVVRMRLRHEQDRGIGRPDEVLLALAEVASRELDPAVVVRERLWTADELPDEPPGV
jgi:radical SAM-linked protein